MKWHLYKRDDPNTWPQIDCPIVVYYPYKQYNDSEDIIFVCRWNNDRNQFYTPMKWWDKKELYYAYIGYVPSEYETHNVTKCADRNYCRTGCEWLDDGYCLLRAECEQQRSVNEYSIKEKAIWKEFENDEN